MKTGAPLFTAKLGAKSCPIQKDGAQALELFSVSRQARGV